MVCSTCGGENVFLDAWAEWDPDNQRWKLAELLQATFCQDCDGECSISEKSVLAP